MCEGKGRWRDMGCYTKLKLSLALVASVHVTCIWSHFVHRYRIWAVTLSLSFHLQSLLVHTAHVTCYMWHVCTNWRHIAHIHQDMGCYTKYFKSFHRFDQPAVGAQTSTWLMHLYNIIHAQGIGIYIHFWHDTAHVIWAVTLDFHLYCFYTLHEW